LLPKLLHVRLALQGLATGGLKSVPYAVSSTAPYRRRQVTLSRGVTVRKKASREQYHATFLSWVLCFSFFVQAPQLTCCTAFSLTSILSLLLNYTKLWNLPALQTQYNSIALRAPLTQFLVLS
jgi:hypothetical protein